MSTRQCRHCSKSFQPNSEITGIKGRTQVFCGDCGSDTGRTKRWRRRNIVIPWIEKTCPVCLKGFCTKYKVKHTCCSVKCRYYWTKIVNFYKLNADSYRNLLERAKGKCEICGVQTELNIDHDHLTGVVRGLLCRPCNNQLGLYERLTPLKISQINTYLNRGIL